MESNSSAFLDSPDLTDNDHVRASPDLRGLVVGNDAVDQEIAREPLHELLMGLLSIDRDHVRMHPHEPIPELGMIFLREPRDLIRALFHPSPLKMRLQSFSLPDRR